MSLERESFKVIQNQANQTFDVPDKPSSARLSRLKDMKSKKLADLDRNNSFEGYFLSNSSIGISASAFNSSSSPSSWVSSSRAIVASSSSEF